METFMSWTVLVEATLLSFFLALWITWATCVACSGWCQDSALTLVECSLSRSTTRIEVRPRRKSCGSRTQDFALAQQAES